MLKTPTPSLTLNEILQRAGLFIAISATICFGVGIARAQQTVPMGGVYVSGAAGSEWPSSSFVEGGGCEVKVWVQYIGNAPVGAEFRSYIAWQLGRVLSAGLQEDSVGQLTLREVDSLLPAADAEEEVFQADLVAGFATEDPVDNKWPASWLASFVDLSESICNCRFLVECPDGVVLTLFEKGMVTEIRPVVPMRENRIRQAVAWNSSLLRSCHRTIPRAGLPWLDRRI